MPGNRPVQSLGRLCRGSPMCAARPFDLRGRGVAGEGGGVLRVECTQGWTGGESLSQPARAADGFGFGPVVVTEQTLRLFVKPKSCVVY